MSQKHILAGQHERLSLAMPGVEANFTELYARTDPLYDILNGNLQMQRTWSGEPPAFDELATPVLATRSVYNGQTTGNQFDIRAAAGHHRLLVGQGISAARGTVLNQGFNTQIYNYASNGAGGGTSEFGGLYSVVNCRHDQTNHDANYWHCDWSQHGPASGQERFMGNLLFCAKYHAAETIDTSHVGYYGWLLTSKPGSGGGTGEGKAGLTSYRGRAAFAVNGWSGLVGGPTDGVDVGATSAWQYAFAAGIAGSPWLGPTARSKYGTAFYATDFVDYGLRIGPQHPDNTAFAIYVEDTAGTVGFATLPDATIALSVKALPTFGIAARFKGVAEDSSIKPRVQIWQENGSVVDNRLLGAMEFVSHSSAGTERTFARIVPGASSSLDGVEEAHYQLRLLSAGAEITPVIVRGTGLDLPTLPTADPHVVGRLWNNAGALKVSAG